MTLCQNSAIRRRVTSVVAATILERPMPCFSRCSNVISASAVCCRNPSPIVASTSMKMSYLVWLQCAAAAAAVTVYRIPIIK